MATVRDVESQIAKQRISGLVRLVARAENRALQAEVEKGPEAAAAVREQVARYRAELERLMGGPQDEDLDGAADVALLQLRAEEARRQLKALEQERQQDQLERDVEQARKDSLQAERPAGPGGSQDRVARGQNKPPAKHKPHCAPQVPVPVAQVQ